MDASLRLGLRHTLHAVHARLVFKRAVHVVARDGEDDLLESARGALADARHGHSPTLYLAVFGVHPIEVAGKECGLVAARAAANLDDGVLSVLRIGRYEHELDLLLQGGQTLLTGRDLFAGHLLEVRIVVVHDDASRFVEVGQQLFVVAFCGQQFLEAFVFFGQPHEAVAISDDLGVSDQRRHLLETRRKAVELLKDGVSVHLGDVFV